ncbi:MAG: beta-propeller fold lactonase family protein [Pleurocapsa sp. MO_226.B13]|nr:beta-propeller fold lactonase family protein [Pleurocapsa sp. MO_226.B13]
MEVINDTQNNDLSTPTATLQTSQVSAFDTRLPIHDSFAVLERREDGVELTLDTDLPPGAYTVWWVVFNNPEFCVDGCGSDDLERSAVNASSFWATGEVVGDESGGSFSVELLEGELPTGSDQVILGDGLEDSFSAEIHPVVRTHGSVIPELEEEQITTLNGGCPPNECENIQFAVFPAVSDADPPLSQITVYFEGDDLVAGTIITEQYSDLGLTISTSSEFGAMLFDTNHPTGEDFDLAAADLGNVLIISENNDASDPDDRAHGGILTFEWDTEVDITGVDLLDIDEPGSSITFFDDDSRAIATLEIPELENNSFQQLGFDVENVARMDISLAGSGAVTAVDFIPSDATQTNNGQIVIANRASGNISILDTRTGEELRTVDLPFSEGETSPEPMYVYHLLSTNEIVVNDRANNRVVFFDQTTYEVTRTVETGAGNFHMWVDPQEKQLWVVNDLDVALTVVELETNETTKVQLPETAIGTNAIPHDVILDPSGLYAYVTVLREDNPDSDLLLKFDTATFEILDTAEVGKDPHLSLAPESNLLYVPTQNSNRIDVFDRRGTELVKVNSIEQPGVHGIDFGLDGRYLYTTNLPGGGANGLLAIDARTNEIVGDLDGIDTPFPSPHNVWLTGDGQRLFMTHSGSEASQVSFYSLDDPTRPVLLDSVEVNGLNPFGLAFTAPTQDDLVVGDRNNDRLQGGNGNDQIFGEDGDDILWGDRGNDKLFGREGHDYLLGGYDNDVLIAGEGDDRLNGGHGNDVMIGVRVESFTPGKGEMDVFKGDKGSDTFVLGDALEVYYDDGVGETMGLKDVAVIRDFNLDESDVIRLHGSADDYQLEQIEAFGLGTAILYTAEGQVPEAIGFIQGMTDLDLSSDAFEFALSI